MKIFTVFDYDTTRAWRLQTAMKKYLSEFGEFTLDVDFSPGQENAFDVHVFGSDLTDRLIAELKLRFG